MTDYEPDDYQKMADAMLSDATLRLRAAYAYRAIQLISAYLAMPYAHPVYMVHDITAATRTVMQAADVPFQPVSHRYHWDLMPMTYPCIKPEESLISGWTHKTGGEINPGILQSLWHIYFHRLPQFKMSLGLWNAGDALSPEQVESLIDSVILSQIGIENPGAYRLSMLETVKREREVHK